MSQTTAPNHQDLAHQLPAELYYELVRTFLPTLPLPLIDSPEHLARRNHAAIAKVAALRPVNAIEADQAALFVAATEQWKACLREAEQPETTSYWAQKCRAQALSMMRQSQGALSRLERMQAARKKLEADPEACGRAAWTEHCALNLMAEALSPPSAPPTTAEPPPNASPPGERSEAFPRNSASIPAPEPQPQPAPADPTPLAAASNEEAVSPQWAAKIRLLERLRDPDENLVQAIMAAGCAGRLTDLPDDGLVDDDLVQELLAT